MTIEVLAKSLNVSEDEAKSILFRVVDYLISQDPSDDVITCGEWTNSPMNGIDNMIESYRAMLWASFEELDGQKVDKPGPWVTLDPDTMLFKMEKR
ncbi:hypothetical protein PHIM7_145 [Sinorhizobium phage phiM7]|uniref:Uncharacterized protein n=2 Tax=Emdodecavirus TaxID=1980937 RepID=S5MD36_9CAUD|nr:hypothetical protein AB690_gp352 [Sinorhizobium phage phiM12]YP_009601270.1 hypothetical protein FDH46_gp333 [Sinorhizobium phage phiM7]AGR47844.1 hypothetical protein SmphiM12_212 [Sinorhizobium phage phiM12]AKF12691.1 hypothetical protein PHIM7_145 [Sinorhizobium phage phiM7]AKF13050.1 hypothetical protein PHIM19_145 [Sinorhizobium phage phiM19]